MALLLVLGSCKGPAVGESASSSDAGTDAADSGSDFWTLVYEDPAVAAGDSLNAMWASGPDDVWAVGTNRQILHFDGQSWDGLNKTQGSDLYGIWGASPSEVVAAGTNIFDTSPTVYNYDGQLWTSGAPFPSTVTGLTDVWGIGTQRYFTGLAGHIFQDDPVGHPTDRYHTAAITGGCPNQTDPAPNLNAIDAEDLNEILAAGDNALIAQKDAIGWARFCGPDTSVHYSAVFHIPGTPRYYIGSNFLGILLWLSRAEPLAQITENYAIADADKSYIQGIHGDATRIVAVGDHGTVLYFDGGSDVKPLPSPTSDSLRGVVLIPPNTVYVCGDKNRIWRAEL